MRLHQTYRFLFTVFCLAFSYPGMAGTNLEPYEQDFLITAYYSPLEGQCCYVMGSVEADKYLNGRGTNGADGTPVYPGMLAAPPTYSFGTKVHLPGIGTLTVHDRGGAIQKLANGKDRLDIWAGHGEEGLARALAFGLQSIRGTVYPPGFDQPATEITLEDLPAPLNRLQEFKTDSAKLLAVNAKFNDYSESVRMLQEKLQSIGYYLGPLHGVFNDRTKASLNKFLTDYRIEQPADELTSTTAAHLLAAHSRSSAREPIRDFVAADSDPTTLKEAQRILRFLGYYSGRTDGVYNDKLFNAILAFQQDYFLVGTKDDPGAGQIGPITLTQIKGAWDRKLVAKKAGRLEMLQALDTHMKDHNLVVNRFLEEGWRGEQVELLQTMLADRGFFPHENINANFGPLTKKAVMDYQLDRDIIASRYDDGAGYVGPATLAQLQRERRSELYNLVRAEGWQAL